MQLSDHFSLAELTFSDTAERRGLPVETPPDIIANLRRLCLTLLEPIRTQLGKPIIISSGYRPYWLNEAIGGAKNSSHLLGCAADCRVIGMPPIEFARWIRRNGYAPDQCIEEFGRWVHLSVPRAAGAAPRNEFLAASYSGKGTKYEVMK